MRMLDLFSGRWGWGRAFAARGWEVIGIDLVEPPEIPAGCTFIKADILELMVIEDGDFHIPGVPYDELGHFDFVCASSPCEQFSVHGLKCFHKSPPYPEMGIKLFNHTRSLCEASGLPYIMENVRSAQDFVGRAVNHCGPFYLWGNSVPPMLPQGIRKGISIGNGKATHGMTQEEKRLYRKESTWTQAGSKSKERRELTATASTIPPQLSACVCDYAERILEVPA